MEAARQKDKLQKEERKTKLNHSKKRKKSEIEVGDMVLIKDFTLNIKFDPLYIPEVFEVIEV